MYMSVLFILILIEKSVYRDNPLGEILSYYVLVIRVW